MENLKMTPHYLLDVTSQASIASVYSPQYFDGNCSNFHCLGWEFIIQSCLEPILGDSHLIILLSPISINWKLNIVYTPSLLIVIIHPLLKAFVWWLFCYNALLHLCMHVRHNLVPAPYKDEVEEMTEVPFTLLFFCFYFFSTCNMHTMPLLWKL